VGGSEGLKVAEEGGWFFRDFGNREDLSGFEGDIWRVDSCTTTLAGCLNLRGLGETPTGGGRPIVRVYELKLWLYKEA
jgi:hypothetical protein